MDVLLLSSSESCPPTSIYNHSDSACWNIPDSFAFGSFPPKNAIWSFAPAPG